MTDAERALVEAALALNRQDMNIREIGKVSALIGARNAVIAERTPPEVKETLRRLWFDAWKAERAATAYSRKLYGEQAESIRMAAYEEVFGGEKE